jgi:hypothetical protein
VLLDREARLTLTHRDFTSFAQALTCRSDDRRRGLGKLLTGCAVDRGLKAKQQGAAYALLVDTKDDGAKAF